MQRYTRTTRQAMGCGYEPPAPAGLPVMVWDHEARRGEPATTCPGYTTSLPEVIEVSHARLHWSNGQLAIFVHDQPTEHLTAAIVTLEAEICAFQRWKTTPKTQGGGA